MSDEQLSQTKILAQAVYEIRVLLAGCLGSENTAELPVRVAAHLAYALHNEALAVLEDRSFDPHEAIDRLRAVDRLFGEDFSERFAVQCRNEA